MEGYRNNISSLCNDTLVLDFRLNNNMCISIFDINGQLFNHNIKWHEITFITDAREIQFWKTFHEEMCESIDLLFSGEKIILKNTYFTGLFSIQLTMKHMDGCG